MTPDQIARLASDSRARRIADMEEIAQTPRDLNVEVAKLQRQKAMLVEALTQMIKLVEDIDFAANKGAVLETDVVGLAHSIIAAVGQH
jgi:hypothetical protein